MSTTITPTEQNIDINVTEDVIDINVTNNIVDVNATAQQINIEVAGAYPIPNAVNSVFGRTGNVIAAEGDYSLTQLSDVTLTTPANGQVLKYNGTIWVNSTDADTGITTLNTLTALSQTFAVGSSGTDFNISSATSTHTFNFPTANATNRGLLSSADWTTFNNKQSALTNPVTGTGTTNTLPKFTGTSAIGNSNITDTGSLITLGSNSLINGNVGIGISPLSNVNLYVFKTITGGVNAWGIYNGGTIQSDVTTHAQIFRSDPLTAASAFTLSQLSHFNTNGTTLGAGSSVTNQNGFFVNANFIQGTNNYGFRGLIPSGTNRWNLYMDGTADNYIAGSLGIGSTSLSLFGLRISKPITGGTIAYNQFNDGSVQSDVTSEAMYYSTNATTAAAAFTLTKLFHYRCRYNIFGASSAVTNQYGFFVDSTLTAATNNYAFYSSIASGTNRWNLYMAGTAANYMAGRLGIGVTNPAYPLDILGFANSTSGFRVTDGTIDNRISWSSGNIGFFGTISNHPIAFHTNTTERARITINGSFGIGTGASINASAKVQVDSTTQGFLPPRMTTTQKLAIATPAAGLMVYDTTLNQMSYYNGTLWINF